MLKGIDISNYQQKISFTNYDFVIMKASEGVGYKDIMLDTHYNSLHGSSDGKPDHNKLYGFYHYARPETGNTARAEADYFLSLVGHHAKNCIFALDWEGNSTMCSPTWAHQWLKRVYEKTGVKPLIYMSSSECCTGKYQAISADDYGLWVAHWGVSQPTYRDFPVYALWQYTSTPLDTNMFNGDVNTWDKYVGRTKNVNVNHSIKIGDKVKVKNIVDYNGVHNDSWVLNKVFDVMEVKGDRIVIGTQGVVTGVWNKNNLKEV